MMLRFFAAAAAFLMVPSQAGAQAPSSLHAPWEALLRAHVRAGLVDYDAFAASAEFQKYLQALSATKLDGMPRNDRLAFWINAYNAYTIQLVNKHEERESIKNINKLLGVLPFKGPWTEPVVRAAGRFLTLDEVKDSVIRPEFLDPRALMALSCGAMSCPPLRYEAYDGARIDEQLTDQTRIFLRERPSSNQLDILSETLSLSKIFETHRRDFGSGKRALQDFVAPYFPGEAEQKALASKKLRIEFTNDEWDLNIQTQLKTK